MLSLIIILISLLINSILSSANINLEYGGNDTIILSYNLTTNYSYFLTFRSFDNKQLKFGLFLPSNKTENNSIEILYQYPTTDVFDLFIICFHFLLPFNNLNIQCNDIRFSKKGEMKSHVPQEFLPSYNPLFVPMMYALSIVMLLPIIIQQHRRKQALLSQRQKELRRLSVSIAEDNHNPKQNFVRKLLSQIIENGTINYRNIPVDIELVSAPSTNPILDDNVNVPFILQNLQPLIPKYDDNDINENSAINALDCVAHLLDNTPWNTPDIDQPLITSLSRHVVIRDSATTIKEQHLPTIISLHDDNDDDRKPILKPNKNPPVKFYRTNRVFVESDV